MRGLARFPVLLCPMAEAGGAAEGEGGESLPLLHLTIVSQTGEPRGQVYYPYITFRTSGVLQVWLGFSSPNLCGSF